MILIVLIRRYYWRTSYFVNTEFLQEYTPTYYGFSDSCEWSDWIKQAHTVCKKSSLVICGMMRDCEDRIPSIIDRVEQYSKVFGTVSVLVVENDSTDGTRRALLDWSSKAKGYTVQVLGCGINSPICRLGLKRTEGHPVEAWRMAKMALLRNIYLDHCKIWYRQCDYLLVWDMDVLGSLYVDGVMSSANVLSQNPSIDGVCSKGIYSWPGVDIYYDTLAHHETRFPDWIEGRGVIEQVYKGCVVGGQELDLVPVKGCFAGATLYRMSSMLDKTYKTDGNKCEHDSISNSLNMVMNPTMINYILLNK